MKKYLILPPLLLAAITPASAQVPLVYSSPLGPGTMPITASAVGTTGAVSATLSGSTGYWTYICGFVITSGGTTTASAGDAMITGTTGGTLNFTYVDTDVGQGSMGATFAPSCIRSSTTGQSIVVTAPAGGTGTTAAVTAWGYIQQ